MQEAHRQPRTKYLLCCSVSQGRGTYPSQEVSTLAGGVPTLAGGGGTYTLPEGYLPLMGVPILDRGYPFWLEGS